jgi:hypothetical protein
MRDPDPNDALESASASSFWTARAETLLARLYVDADARAAFVADPRAVTAAAGLGRGEAAALAALDRTGLELAAKSFAAKRAHAPRRRSWLRRLSAR